MSACEECWSRAAHRALLGYGHTADLYHEELVKHEEQMLTEAILGDTP